MVKTVAIFDFKTDHKVANWPKVVKFAFLANGYLEHGVVSWPFLWSIGHFVVKT